MNMLVNMKNALGHKKIVSKNVENSHSSKEVVLNVLNDVKHF